MFGYVRADKPEMRIREYEYYRGIYCGLCRALGKCGGQCARMTLSYDFAFMAIVRMAVEENSPVFKNRRCIAHPTKKRPMAEVNETLEFCAASSLLLSYHKIKDDEIDEKGGKRVIAKAVKPIFSLMKRKSSKKYRELEGKIIKSLSMLDEYERNNAEPSIDRPAEMFGDLLADIMSYGLDGAHGRIARKIGMHVGKWIYVIDAADDYEEDVRLGRFNPIVSVYGQGGLSESVRDAIETALINELMEAEKAFDLIDYQNRDIKEVISNIIYLGMPAVTKKTLAKTVRKEDK